MQYAIHIKFEQSIKYLKFNDCLTSYTGKYIKRKQTSLATNKFSNKPNSFHYYNHVHGLLK